MQRLQKIGHVTPKNAAQVRSSRLGIGFEKLDRDVFDPEKAYDKVAALGVKWVRIQSGWQRTEREKGVYSFAWLDSIVDQLIVRGLRPWICLCYGNGLYDENAAKIFGAVGVPPIFTQEQRAAWRGYVAALVERYRDRVSHYEIWNEPDWCWKHGADATELGNFTVDTARVIRSVYPGARIIGGVLCDPSLDFINRALLNQYLEKYGLDFTAMVFAQDSVAISVMYVMQNMGIRIPEDVSVIGYDDLPEAKSCIPALTTIRQDYDTLADNTVQYMLHHIQHREDATSYQQTFIQELVHRDSVRFLHD